MKNIVRTFVNNEELTVSFYVASVDNLGSIYVASVDNLGSI